MCSIKLYAVVLFIVAIGCEIQTESPEPPPFRYDTLEFEANDIRYVYYEVSSSELSQGQWCLEYEVDLKQDDEENPSELFSYIALPTGERVREVVLSPINSPIQGRVYAEQVGRYTLVLGDPPREGMTLVDALRMVTQTVLKTASVKTRMYSPCD